MDRIDSLIREFENFISIKWRQGLSPSERVIICIYNEKDELLLREKIPEFELITINCGHRWYLYDLTDTFAQWLLKHRYAESYFRRPALIKNIYDEYLDFIKDSISGFLEDESICSNSILALKGLGSIYGILKAKNLIESIAPMTESRLLVFFPGTYENNNYRLLDGYDGWNYLAVPIMAKS